MNALLLCLVLSLPPLSAVFFEGTCLCDSDTCLFVCTDPFLRYRVHDEYDLTLDTVPRQYLDDAQCVKVKDCDEDSCRCAPENGNCVCCSTIDASHEECEDLMGDKGRDCITHYCCKDVL